MYPESPSTASWFASSMRIYAWLAAAKIISGRILRVIRKNRKVWGIGLDESAIWMIVRHYAAQIDLNALVLLIVQQGRHCEHLVGHSGMVVYSPHFAGKRSHRLYRNRDYRGYE
jgi:hypothetical protein